jgi:predicted nucleic acid-binding protein
MTRSTASSTASSLFLDTGGYYALVVERDEHHWAAKRIMVEATKRRQRLVTTDYVLAETATLLTARGYSRYVEPLFDSVFSSKACTITGWTRPYSSSSADFSDSTPTKSGRSQTVSAYQIK